MLGVLLDAVLLYLAIGWQSMREHIWPIERALLASDEPRARQALSLIVSRDTAELDQQQIATAACESLLENSSDALFASLFWYALGGPVMVIMHRLANTLDAMWGYRTDRYQYFGRAAARLDDVLNWVPARLTALTYSLLGDVRGGFRCWRAQAPAWDSPNAGPVMAAGAGALRVVLGGPAPYASGIKQRPVLGEGEPASAETIDAAIQLVHRGVWLWLGLLAAVAILGWITSAAP